MVCGKLGQGNSMKTIGKSLLACSTLLLSFHVAVASLAAAQTRVGSADFAAIDAYVEAQVKDLRVPGLALAIVRGDTIVHLKGLGIADPSGRRVTPQTPFIIGSTSKSFTALAIMQLVEAGKVELDAPVQRYISWFRVADPEASARMTVRQLLNQTSGFSTRSGRDQPSDLTDRALEERVRSFRNVQLAQSVGATYQYSGANYATLGMIVQAVTGQSFEAYVEQHIFAPLDMRHSYTSQAEAQQNGLAMGYRYRFGKPVAGDLPYNRGSLPQGYLISSAEDMSHYLIAQLNGGQYANASILSSTGIAAMHQPAVRAGRTETSYGMGWKVGPTNGVPTVWHDGSVFNFHSNVVLIPEGRWGIVVLKNAYNSPDEFTGTNRLSGIAAGVTSLLTGGQPPASPPNTGLYLFYGIPLIIVAVQVMGMIRSSLTFRDWRAHPDHRPRRRGSTLRIIGIPLVLNLAWAVLILVGLPRIIGSLSMILTGFPDLGYVLVASALVALAWSIIRTGWALVVLRNASRSIAAGLP
jgi:CubicO group peptidase (beta-lactamase class C family)